MNIYLLGGGWINDNGWGNLKNADSPQPGTGRPVLPAAEDIFDEPPVRYGRFDTFTCMGCVCAALALKEASLENRQAKRRVGLIISSSYECYDTDMAYYRTTFDKGGVFTSPKKFSYTLPGIVLGECSVYFKLTGPTFVVGESGPEKGKKVLDTSVLILRSGQADTIICGWLDSPPAEEMITGTKRPEKGAFFAVLSAKKENSLRTFRAEALRKLSLFDLFRRIS